jgi:hypothetical protein
MSYFLHTNTSFGALIMRVNSDNSVTCIPADENNVDYVAYLAWQAAGNTAAPWPEQSGE